MYVLAKNGIDSLVVSSYLIKSKYMLIVGIQQVWNNELVSRPDTPKASGGGQAWKL